MNEQYLGNYPNSMVDWYAFSLSRCGYSDNFGGYLDAVTHYVTQKYDDYGELDGFRATEWHRLALAIEAAGGDARSVGGHDLVFDGTFGRQNIGAQGVNGWIWGLIVLNSLDIKDFSGGIYTRDDFVDAILSRQLADGGFSLTGSAGDVDTTAMAILALSRDFLGGNGVVEGAIGRAIEFLMAAQQIDGGFSSFGVKNSISSAWAVIGLSAIGINIRSDERFIRNNLSIFDNILRFRRADGGFSFRFGGGSDDVASYQIVLAMNALIRMEKGESGVFDLT